MDSCCNTVEPNFFLYLSAILTISSKSYTDPTLARHKRRKLDRFPEPKQDSEPAITSNSSMTHEQAPNDLSLDTKHRMPTLKQVTNGSEVSESSEDLARKSTRTRSTRKQTSARKNDVVKVSGGASEEQPSTSEQALKRTRKNASNHQKTDQLDNNHSKDLDLTPKGKEKAKVKRRIIPSVQLSSSRMLTESDVIHDDKNMLFKITLDDQGMTGELLRSLVTSTWSLFSRCLNHTRNL
jgi:hypothetical protein